MLQGWLQLALFALLIIAITPLLGGYMANVFTGRRTFASPVLGPLERLTLGAFGAREAEEQDWKRYARCVLLFSAVGWALLYLILRTQTLHPFNPGNFNSGTWDLTFNTATSFVTNTNWQFYGGETTLSNFSQMAGLTVQNFVSAGVGLAVAVALIRAIASRRGDGSTTIGNFWQDLTRAIVHVLLPLAFITALVFASQGVVQSFGGSVAGIFRGPVASQESIKLLGTNGGGFFNVNSAHPLENPTSFTNLLQMLMILSIPAALTATFGRMVGSRRQGWAIFATMGVIFVAGVIVVFLSESNLTPAQAAAGLTGGGNLEGKDLRNGEVMSSLYAAVTTVTSCGAVNAAMESLTGIGSLVPMANMGVSETVFGGVGTGIYTMLLFVILATFIGGLMVGRTPELLGKKIEGKEMKLVTIGAIASAFIALAATALAVGTDYGSASQYASAKPQAFSETLYAYLSQANNNGSAFAGYTGYLQPAAGNLGANGVSFADIVGGLAMFAGRFTTILAVLAVAGLLVGKRATPAGAGTMRTDTPTFAVLLGGVVIIVGALTFFPAFLLGPAVQGLTDHLF